MMSPLRLRLSLALCIFLLPPLSAQSPGDPGPYPAGYRDITFTDSDLQTPEVNARLFYPATAAGANQPIADGPFPVIAFGHGFNLSYLDYQNLCDHLASWGFFVITPDVQNGFDVDHQEYARELAACLSFLLAAGDDPDSDLYQRITPQSGVYGHSMGGGAACLVPGVYPSIGAVSGLAAAETNPSAIDAIADYAGPFQAISGSEDNITPEAEHQIPMYEGAQGLKQWVSLTGAGHCKFTDGFTICDVVSAPGSLSREETQLLSNLYTTAFFRYHLADDNTMLPWLCGDSIQVAADAGTISYATTISCMTTGLQEPSPNPLYFSPNPAGNELLLGGVSTIEIYSSHGQRIQTLQLETGEEVRLNISGWAAGLYFIRNPENGQTARLVKW